MAGKKGFGAIMAYESAVPGTYTPIVNVTKITPYEVKADVIDVSAHDSPADANGNGWREKLAGLLDAGAAMFDCNYDDKAATHAYLKANVGVSKNFRITFPGTSPTTATFAGFIKQVGPEIPHDNKLTAQVAIEISGQITIA